MSRQLSSLRPGRSPATRCVSPIPPPTNFVASPPDVPSVATARLIRLESRGTRSHPGQTLLLRATHRSPRESFEIGDISRKDLDRDIIPMLHAKDRKLQYHAHDGARTAYRVFYHQDPTRPNHFQARGTDTQDLMPGGIPVIDQLCAALRDSPGWGSLQPVIEGFMQHRCPSVTATTGPEVVSLTLGKDTPDRFQQVVDWLHTARNGQCKIK